MKVGIVMDPIASFSPKKDGTFAMMLEIERRGWVNYIIDPHNIWLQSGMTWASMQAVQVFDDEKKWYTLGETIDQPMTDLDFCLMRKDPPFDMDYITLTYLLEQAEAQGLPVINKPSSLRDANEKLFTAWFPQCCPKTLVTSSAQLILDFVESEGDAVIKPLDSMGGQSVFRLQPNDSNLPVIAQTMTRAGRRHVMVQRFIPEITQGDKRILMIQGEPVPYALVRVPAPGDFRGNIAVGASAEGRELTDQDRWICEQVGPVLKQKGLVFVGLDVIGNYLTEINVTSPTGIRELDRFFDLNIAGALMDALEFLC